ncbi:MAG: prepilin-type N-terminal cleavage/methylation domain-containing protein [Ruminococcus sp.]|nr:prepilin-type N-terminal cleavage/methylation domain-containing protein [Ruminococcus sp.]
MKTKLKAFTLIELIVVMAILMIMMAAIMKFFEPIRQVYNDATYYEQRRSVTNSMCKYTTESIRYAKFLGIYSQSEVGVAADPKAGAIAAVNRFKTSLANNEEGGVVKPIIIKANTVINVIELDYGKQYYATSVYNNKNYDGRLYRTKGEWSVSGTSGTYTPTNTHLAFGQGYYGANNYYMQWAYQGGKFEAYAASYDNGGTLNPDGVVVRSVTATVLKNLDLVSPGKVFFTDSNGNDTPDFTETGASLTTTGTNIPYGMMSSTQNYFLVWIDGDRAGNVEITS